MNKTNPHENISTSYEEIADNELADITETFEFGVWHKNNLNKERLIENIDKKYFKDFLDKLESLETEKVKKIETLLDINLEDIKKTLDNTIPIIIEKINIYVEKEEFKLAERCSFCDILGNSVLTGINVLLWMIDNIDNPNKKIQEKIKNPDSNKRAIVEKHFKNMFSKDGDVTYYLNELCNNEDKLKMEISSEIGFINKFSRFFKETPTNITGSKKLPFFRFFSKFEKDEITVQNVESELQKINISGLDIEKIIKELKK